MIHEKLISALDFSPVFARFSISFHFCGGMACESRSSFNYKQLARFIL